MELENKLTDLASAFSEFRKENDKVLSDIKTKGAAAADRIEKVDKLNETISSLEAEIKSIQTAMARGAQGGDNEEAATKASKAQSEAMQKYLRKGVETAELKAMSVNSDEDGGFYVTPQMSSEVVKKVYETSPMRQLASVETISTDALEFIEDLDEADAEWVGETSTRNETNSPKIKKLIIPVHEMSAQPKATQKLLDDAAVNIEAWLAGKVAEKMARKENTAFVSGDGVAKPKGILSYADGDGFDMIEQVQTAGSLAITGDDLIELEYALKGEYKKNGSWMAKRQVIKLFRKFKDSQGRYLWEPGLNGAAQATLLGFPIYEANDMQDAAANSLSVAFGDFKAGYQIVDRVGIRVIRDIYTAKPYIKFYTTKRVGGAVKNFEAIKLLKVKA